MSGLPLAAGLLALAAALAVPARAPVGPPRPRGQRAVEQTPRWWRWAAPVGVFLLVMAVVGGTFGLMLAVVAAVWAWRMFGGLESRRARARRVLLERRAPVVADLVADALAAGASPVWALQVAADATDPLVREELGPLIARLDLGADPISVWRVLAAHPQFAPIGRAFTRSSETGGSVTAAMRNSAQDLRAKERASREASARAVSVKAAGPLGAFLLPAFVLVGIAPTVAGAIQGFLG